MPYIITTKRPDERPSRVGFADDMRVTGSPRAVATLDEARSIAWQALIDAHGHVGRQVPSDQAHAWRGITEPGDTVTLGPLPGDTVIEVRPVTWPELGELAGRIYHFAEYDQTVDAFNAKGQEP